MDLASLSFELKDRNGAAHTYVVTPHNATQGFVVLDAMLTIGLGPLAEAFFSAAQAPEGADGKVTLAAMIEYVDKENLVRSMQAGVQGAGGLAKLAPLVFKHTTRDGVFLAKPADLDIAYTQNYSEMLQAFKKILEINGFFDALGGMLGGAE